MMSALLIYAIKSAILLTLLFVPGIFLMFKEKMFRFNRMTLLAILLLSLVLPLCNFSRLSMDRMPAVQAIEQGLIQAGIPVEVPNYISTEDITSQEKPFPWFYVVSILYGIGVMTILCIRLREVLSMGRIIRRGSIWAKDDDGIRIYCHAENVAPFSWLRNIVISEADHKENGREIILHEKAHILYRHSLDIILLTLVEAVQWWNPFVYLLGMYLRDVHEYEADDYVLRQGVSCHSYSELVIRKAVGANSYTFANNFNHSLTKKRITMMLKTNSKRSRRSRVLYVLPMIALALSAFATPEFQTATETIEDVVQKGETIKDSNKVIPPSSESGKETIINIHIDSKDNLSCGINHAKLEPISPKDLMELFSKHRGEPTVINLTSEKEFDQMGHIVREASRKNNLLKINYEVKPKNE
ncbi:MAG: M56 family metallopeptidase [Bacteroidaceae bacterium]|nr:M56 family metallopeptidase [Bacteroidaceae bacterium]